MPKWLVPGFIALVITSFIPAAMISRARNTHSSTPRINLIPDMDYQPRFLPQTANPMFADGRAMRSTPEGTVARGELRGEDPFWRGRGTDGEFLARVPGSAMEEFGDWETLVAQGREQFDVYCSICHGSSGYGNGVVHARAIELMELGNAQWTPPTSPTMSPVSTSARRTSRSAKKSRRSRPSSPTGTNCVGSSSTSPRTRSSRWSRPEEC